jgi:hypothetical protein
MHGRARLAKLMDAGRRLFRPRPPDELVHRLAHESGLSPANVRAAIDESLELGQTTEEDERAIDLLAERVKSRTSPRSIAVVLSANVLTAPFRAIAWAVVQSPRVLVRPSRRAYLFPATLAAASDGLFKLARPSEAPEADLVEICDALTLPGELHVYGGADAIETARQVVAGREGVRLEAHGPGVGAILASHEEIVANADAIAADVTAFDQRGCLSPRVAVVIACDPRDLSRAADAMHAALLRRGEGVPRGSLAAAAQAELRLARDAATFHGRALEGPHHLVIERGPLRDAAPAPGPALRVLPMVSVTSAEEGARALARLQPELTVIGSTPETLPARAFDGILASVRVAALGTMQRPALSIGPVDGAS